MSKITWKTERRKVIDLIPADYNPRKISEKERADLTESIKEFSEVEPVVANTNNHLIGGHQRVSIYADLGIEEIDVRIPSRKLTLEEEMRLNLRLNKNTGSWDWSKLDAIDQELLMGIGFTEDEMRINFGISAAEEQNIDEDRMKVLMVYPPETPKLKERIGIYFESIKDYEKVKEAVKDGRITGDNFINLLGL
jgi:ParB-like chromosome segregation protein Spo0J